MCVDNLLQIARDAHQKADRSSNPNKKRAVYIECFSALNNEQRLGISALMECGRTLYENGGLDEGMNKLQSQDKLNREFHDDIPYDAESLSSRFASKHLNLTYYFDAFQNHKSDFSRLEVLKV